jgi:hypothetical protein
MRQPASVLQASEAETHTRQAAAEDAAARIAGDDEDGLGQERRAAVLAEHAVAASGNSRSTLLTLVWGALCWTSSAMLDFFVCSNTRACRRDAFLPTFEETLRPASLPPSAHTGAMALHLHNVGTVSLQSSLARSAHTADLLGTRIVITGGILRDGASHVDVVVVDLADISICRSATDNPFCQTASLSASLSARAVDLNPCNVMRTAIMRAWGRGHVLCLHVLCKRRCQKAPCGSPSWRALLGDLACMDSCWLLWRC